MTPAQTAALAAELAKSAYAGKTALADWAMLTKANWWQTNGFTGRASVPEVYALISGKPEARQ